LGLFFVVYDGNEQNSPGRRANSKLIGFTRNWAQMAQIKS